MKDLLFENNDTISEIGESTLQHQKDIMMFEKGWNKFAPHLGVGIMGYLDDETTVETLKTSISAEFVRDGMNVVDIEITNDGKIRTNANY